MKKVRKHPKRSSTPSFAGIPRKVLESADFQESSPAARNLLLYFAYHYRGANNGDLSASYRQLRRWGGFGSKSTLSRALKELQERNLVRLARAGRFQNPGHLCALYALTWLPVDECPGKCLEIEPTRSPLRIFR